LWADLLNRDATVNPKDVILLLQSALTLLGSALHTIFQERRRVAWSRVNPSFGSFPEDKDEDQEKVKETTLFKGGFLERATKRIDEQKALAKVAGAGNVPPRNANRIKTHGTSGIFWRRAPLQNTAAGTSNARSRIQPSLRGEEKEGPVPSQTTVPEQLTSAHTITSQLLMNVFSPIPGTPVLPTAGRLPLCLHNWHIITADQWEIQTMKGYKLELMSTPLQDSPPGPLASKGHLSVEQEIQKLITKGAVKKVTSCVN